MEFSAPVCNSVSCTIDDNLDDENYKNDGAKLKIKAFVLHLTMVDDIVGEDDDAEEERWHWVTRVMLCNSWISKISKAIFDALWSFRNRFLYAETHTPRESA